MFSAIRLLSHSWLCKSVGTARTGSRPEGLRAEGLGIGTSSERTAALIQAVSRFSYRATQWAFTLLSCLGAGGQRPVQRQPEALAEVALST